MVEVTFEPDFLFSQLVDCHFGGGAYLLVTTNVTNGVNTAFQPPASQLNIVPGKNAKVIYNKKTTSNGFTVDISRYWIFWDPAGQEIKVWHDFAGHIDDLGPSPFGWNNVDAMLAAGGATAANNYTFTAGPPFLNTSASPGYEITQSMNNGFSSGDTKADAIATVNANNSFLGPLHYPPFDGPFPGDLAFRFTINWGTHPNFVSETRSSWEALIQITEPTTIAIAIVGQGSDADSGSHATVNVQIWDGTQFTKPVTTSSQLQALPDDDRMTDAGVPALPSSSYAIQCSLPPLKPSRSVDGTKRQVWLLSSSMHFHENP